MPSISLPPVYSDHMMLQRGKPIIFKGHAKDIKKVSIRFAGECISTNIVDGCFTCEFPPLNETGPFDMEFFADDEACPILVIRDILIGDIWIAAGQSNMEYFLKYDADWNRTRKWQSDPQIRMFNVPRIAFEGQKKDLEGMGYWFTADDKDSWQLFSAPGFAFAHHIRQNTGIPVGVIGCSWGGTPACAWMDEASLTGELDVFNREYEEALSLFTPEELKEKSLEALAFESDPRHGFEWETVMYGLTLKEQEKWLETHRNDPVLPMGPWHHYRPSGLYHTMIETLAPFPIRGFLWYQGESDSGHAVLYTKTMESLVGCFRRTWNDNDLPFLFVQLAPFGKWLECTGDHYAQVRESQEKAARLIRNAYMTSIMDIGSYEDIHPKFKMEVGRRLALLALRHVYGFDVAADPPSVNEAFRDGNRITISFEDTGSSLSSEGHPEWGFELKRGSQPLTLEECSICSEKVILTFNDDDSKNDPVTVSYACRDYCETDLRNAAGVCVRPFRIEV